MRHAMATRSVTEINVYLLYICGGQGSIMHAHTYTFIERDAPCWTVHLHQTKVTLPWWLGYTLLEYLEWNLFVWSNTYTTGIWLFAECYILCRVFYFGHSAKSSLPSATQKTLGRRKHSAKKLFAECFIFDTRQRVSLPSVFFDTR
jgi:hypothetical protein